MGLALEHLPSISKYTSENHRALHMIDRNSYGFIVEKSCGWEIIEILVCVLF